MRTIFELTGGKSSRFPAKILSTVFSSIFDQFCVGQFKTTQSLSHYKIQQNLDLLAVYLFLWVLTHSLKSLNFAVLFYTFKIQSEIWKSNHFDCFSKNCYWYSYFESQQYWNGNGIAFEANLESYEKERWTFGYKKKYRHVLCILTSEWVEIIFLAF